jgi:hypothetical protein
MNCAITTQKEYDQKGGGAIFCVRKIWVHPEDYYARGGWGGGGFKKAPKVPLISTQKERKNFPQTTDVILYQRHYRVMQKIG